MPNDHASDRPALDRVLHRLVAEIAEGLRHGYFEYTVSCEITSQGRRRLLLRAGRHYQFVLPAEECESAPPVAAHDDHDVPQSRSRRDLRS